jgi:hypothetical protein
MKRVQLWRGRASDVIKIFDECENGSCLCAARDNFCQKGFTLAIGVRSYAMSFEKDLKWKGNINSIGLQVKWGVEMLNCNCGQSSSSASKLLRRTACDRSSEFDKFRLGKGLESSPLDG